MAGPEPRRYARGQRVRGADAVEPRARPRPRPPRRRVRQLPRHRDGRPGAGYVGPEPEYYLLAHVSRAAEPGSTRVGDRAAGDPHRGVRQPGRHDRDLRPQRRGSAGLSVGFPGGEAFRTVGVQPGELFSLPRLPARSGRLAPPPSRADGGTCPLLQGGGDGGGCHPRPRPRGRNRHEAGGTVMGIRARVAVAALATAASVAVAAGVGSAPGAGAAPPELPIAHVETTAGGLELTGTDAAEQRSTGRGSMAPRSTSRTASQSPPAATAGTPTPATTITPAARSARTRS